MQEAFVRINNKLKETLVNLKVTDGQFEKLTKDSGLQ
jgi:hypothetical protein